MTKEEQIVKLKVMRKEFMKRFKKTECSCCGETEGLEIHHSDPTFEKFFNLLHKEKYEEILGMCVVDDEGFRFLEGRTN